MQREYTLGELAEITGLPERTLRLYRTKGLLLAPETRGRHAVYTTAHLTRLRMVQSMAERGFPLQVIGEVLDSEVASSAVVYLLESLTSASPDQAADAAAVGSSRPGFDPQAIAEIEAAHPGLVDAMIARGVVRRTPEGGIVGDSFGMAVLADLASQGVPFPQVAVFAAAVSLAGDQIVEEIEKLMHPAFPDEQLRQRLLDAATVVFRETLRHAVRR